MAVSNSLCIEKSRFTQFLIRENGLDKDGFEGWVLFPGMGFNSPDKWWGDQGKRDRPHQGVDLCFYRNRQGRIRRLEVNTQIPAMYEGTVVGMLPDFIGQSVILEQAPRDHGNRRLCAIYGHTTPKDGLFAGMRVKPGQTVAALSDPNQRKMDILPHLHITLGWASPDICYDTLNWADIGVTPMLELLNPLEVIKKTAGKDANNV
jgi:hypothetical protein